MTEEDAFANFENLVRPADQDIKELTKCEITHYNWIRKRDYIQNRRADFWRQIEAKRNEVSEDVKGFRGLLVKLQDEITFTAGFKSVVARMDTLILKMEERDALLMKNAGFNHMVVELYQGGLSAAFKKGLDELLLAQYLQELASIKANYDRVHAEAKIPDKITDTAKMEERLRYETERAKQSELMNKTEVFVRFSYDAGIFSQMYKFKIENGYKPRNQSYLHKFLKGNTARNMEAIRKLVEVGCVKRIEVSNEVLYDPFEFPVPEKWIPSAENESAVVAPNIAPTRQKQPNDVETKEEKPEMVDETNETPE